MHPCHGLYRSNDSPGWQGWGALFRPASGPQGGSPPGELVIQGSSLCHCVIAEFGRRVDEASHRKSHHPIVSCVFTIPLAPPTPQIHIIHPRHGFKQPVVWSPDLGRLRKDGLTADALYSNCFQANHTRKAASTTTMDATVDTSSKIDPGLVAPPCIHHALQHRHTNTTQYPQAALVRTHLHLRPLRQPLRPHHLEAGLPPRLHPHHLSHLPQPTRHLGPSQDLWQRKDHRRGADEGARPAR